MTDAHHAGCAALEAPDRSPAPCDCGAAQLRDAEAALAEAREVVEQLVSAYDRLNDQVSDGDGLTERAHLDLDEGVRAACAWIEKHVKSC